MKNNTVKLLLLLISFIALWILTCAFNMIVLWFVVLNISATYIIYKYRTFDKFDTLMGILFGLVCIPSNLVMGGALILPYIASMMIFKESTNKVYLFKNNKKANLIITLILVLGVGGVLAGINVLLAIGSMPMNVSFRMKWLLDALRAGISEEILFRFFFFALCVYVIKDQQLTKFQSFLCYFIMIVPHMLMHFNLQTFNLGGAVVLTVLFGVPFGIMQRKSNLVSAIGSHALVDLVRFSVFGV